MLCSADKFMYTEMIEYNNILLYLAYYIAPSLLKASISFFSFFHFCLCYSIIAAAACPKRIVIHRYVVMLYDIWFPPTGAQPMKMGCNFVSIFFRGIVIKWQMNICSSSNSYRRTYNKTLKCWAVCCYLVRTYRYAALDRFAVFSGFSPNFFFFFKSFLIFLIALLPRVSFIDSIVVPLSLPSAFFIFLRNSDAHIL